MFQVDTPIKKASCRVSDPDIRHQLMVKEKERATLDIDLIQEKIINFKLRNEMLRMDLEERKVKKLKVA